MMDMNKLMNRIELWNQPVHPETGISQGVLLRHGGTRAANLFLVAPLEVYHAGKNFALLFIQAPSGVLKVGVNAVSYFAKSNQTIQKLNSSLYSLSDFMRSMGRVMSYAIAAFSSMTIGSVFSPSLNFKIHCAMGLVVDQRKVNNNSLVKEEKLLLFKEYERKLEENPLIDNICVI
jgi:hypothetical protein